MSDLCGDNSLMLGLGISIPLLPRSVGKAICCNKQFLLSNESRSVDHAVVDLDPFREALDLYMTPHLLHSRTKPDQANLASPIRLGNTLLSLSPFEAQCVRDALGK